MKILLIEDEPFMQDAVSSVLEHKGLEVILASSAKEAIDKMDLHQYSLVLTDIYLPGPEGIDVVRTLKNNPALRNVPVVVVSGMEERERQKFDIPADDWLCKPFTLEQLSEVLKKYSIMTV